MRHPVFRCLLAAVIAALSASLLIGTAFAESPVPQQPPGSIVVIPEPTGREVVIASHIPLQVTYTSVVESTFQVTTEADAEFFGVALMSSVTTVCKTPQFNHTYGSFELEAAVRFCSGL